MPKTAPRVAPEDDAEEQRSAIDERGFSTFFQGQGVEVPERRGTDDTRPDDDPPPPGVGPEPRKRPVARR